MLDCVKISDIHVICSFDIQKQVIDNQEAQGHQFVIKKVYQIRRNIWHIFNYTFTESIKSKLGDKKKIRSLYVFEWCICKHYLSCYIWLQTELLYKHWSMFLICGIFYIIIIIFCHSFFMLYHVLLCSCHPCNLTLLFSYLSLTIPL